MKYECVWRFVNLRAKWKIILPLDWKVYRVEKREKKLKLEAQFQGLAERKTFYLAILYFFNLLFLDIAKLGGFLSTQPSNYAFNKW